MSKSDNVALLAPVPLVHLESGVSVCQKEGRVAFGSRAWETFQELDALREGHPVRVWIYASLEHASGPPEATWSAFYQRYVHSKNGAHPEGMRLRPPTTGDSANDNLGYWAIFWEVTDLAPLPSDERLRTSKLRSLKTEKLFKPTFVPEGPTLIVPPAG